MAKKTVTLKSKARARTKPKNGDVIRIQNVGAGAAVAAGRGSKALVATNAVQLPLADWASQIKEKIDSLSQLSQLEKDDLKQQIEKIEDEATKGSKAETSRLEKLINTLAIMSPDIFDVAIATLASPLAGFGMVIKKIGEKAKIEQEKISPQ